MVIRFAAHFFPHGHLFLKDTSPIIFIRRAPSSPLPGPESLGVWVPRTASHLGMEDGVTGREASIHNAVFPGFAISLRQKLLAQNFLKNYAHWCHDNEDPNPITLHNSFTKGVSKTLSRDPKHKNKSPFALLIIRQREKFQNSQSTYGIYGYDVPARGPRGRPGPPRGPA